MDHFYKRIGGLYCLRVLILVVMESLGSKLFRQRLRLMLRCLNPCCNGKPWIVQTVVSKLSKRMGLNPCCNGKPWIKLSKYMDIPALGCLNPCCNGKPWILKSEALVRSVFRCLNPCCNGKSWISHWSTVIMSGNQAS